MQRWTAEHIHTRRGRRFIVTGPGGLGYETALALTRRGGHVILAGRNPAKGHAARDRIRGQVTGAEVEFEPLDLANLASIRHFAARIAQRWPSLDVLVNNAGVMAPPQRRVTVDGFELQLGTNHLGHFALTGLLLPLLRASTEPRVVTVSSIAHRSARIAFGDLQSERRYRPWASYGQSKLANLMFAIELQRRSDAAGWKLLSAGAHPGVSQTELVANGPGRHSLINGLMRAFGSRLLQPAWQGALPSLYAATSPGAEPGGYYGPDGIMEMRGWPKPAGVMPQAANAASAQRLWDLSEQLTGVVFR